MLHITLEKLANAHCTSTVCTMFTRVSQSGSNFRFVNVFIIRQAHLFSKTPKQANFCISLQNSQAEIELCANILSLHCDKTNKDRELIFCSKVP